MFIDLLLGKRLWCTCCWLNLWRSHTPNFKCYSGFWPEIAPIRLAPIQSSPQRSEGSLPRGAGLHSSQIGFPPAFFCHPRYNLGYLFVFFGFLCIFVFFAFCIFWGFCAFLWYNLHRLIYSCTFFTPFQTTPCTKWNCIARFLVLGFKVTISLKKHTHIMHIL